MIHELMESSQLPRLDEVTTEAISSCVRTENFRKHGKSSRAYESEVSKALIIDEVAVRVLRYL